MIFKQTLDLVALSRVFAGLGCDSAKARRKLLQAGFLRSGGVKVILLARLQLSRACRMLSDSGRSKAKIVTQAPELSRASKACKNHMLRQTFGAGSWAWCFRRILGFGMFHKTRQCPTAGHHLLLIWNTVSWSQPRWPLRGAMFNYNLEEQYCPSYSKSILNPSYGLICFLLMLYSYNLRHALFNVTYLTYHEASKKTCLKARLCKASHKVCIRIVRDSL